MAILTIKIATTGEEFEIEDVDLSQLTPRQLIDEMINLGILSAETIAPYGIVNKNNVKIDDGELCLSFAQLGFVDGDTIRIIMRASGGGGNNLDSHQNKARIDVKTTWDGAGFELEDVDLEQITNRDLIQEIIGAGVMVPESQLPHATDNTPTMYSLIDKAGVKVEPDDVKSLAELGFTDGDTVRIVLRGSGGGGEKVIKRFTFSPRPQRIKAKQDKTQQPSTREEPLSGESAVGGALAGAAIGGIFGGPVGALFGSAAWIINDWLDKGEKPVIPQTIEVQEVFGSIFAPAEVKRKSHMLVQVYLHLHEETEKVKTLAQESDKKAGRRDYIPLQCKLKKGDKVDVLLNIYGETLLISDKKSVVWQCSFTKCSFDYFVPKDIDVDELCCVALLSVNGVPVGEMRFITKIVEQPRQLNPEILAHKYSKVFISYSHQDESKVKFLHEGLELGAVPHFFDRKYLKAGDVFPQVIQDYINSADLFILCWSENASKSEYVKKERLQALERAFPQVRPEQAAKLRIYPMSIEPHAELPGDMKNYYHFGEI